MHIKISAVTFDDEEIEEAISCLRSANLTMGSRCLAFEKAFAEYLGAGNAIFVNSGSSANLLAWFAVSNPMIPERQGRRRLGPGTEVIVPAVSWSTTIWPIVQAGCVPVLVDCDPDTLQMNLDALKAAIGPKTGAVCVIHAMGNATPMAPVVSLAAENGLWLVEDTCEALGTRHGGRYTGCFGQIGTFSFYFSHHISTIEGGMVVTDDDEIADLLRSMRSHGWSRHRTDHQEIERRHPEIDPRFLFITTGFNLRPTELNAAFGLRQLSKLSAFNRRRNEIGQAWHEAFRPLADGEKLAVMRTTEDTEHAFFGYPVLCRSSAEKEKLTRFLEDKGIETRPIICGNMARQPAFAHVSHHVAGSLAGSDRIMDTGLYWGVHPRITDEEVVYVGNTVRSFFAE
jgi:CDP-6-deoxy-D-xylo-4-hexulose-3-dehydrase